MLAIIHPIPPFFSPHFSSRPQILLLHPSDHELRFITLHRAHVHHSLSIHVPQLWHSQPKGFGFGVFELVVAVEVWRSRAMLDWDLGLGLEGGLNLEGGWG